MKGIKVVTKPNGRRYVYRRVGARLVPLPDLPENDPRFLAAYAAAGEAPATTKKAPAGSIAALCEAYLASQDYHHLGASTRAVWRRLVDRIRAERGKGLVRDLRPDHIRRDVREKTPGAAQMRLKAWRSLLRFAVEEGWIETNPSRDVKPARSKVVPHRQWTAEEIEAFRAHWPIGSPQRCAFEVILWTGARCVDARRLGWPMVRDGWLSYVQEKTDGPASCPVKTLPKWLHPLARDHAHFLAVLPDDRLQWIVSRTGKPRSTKALSQYLSAAAKAAGVNATAHGLRKTRASRLAEAGASPHQIGAWTGHRSLSEVSHYTREASQRAILEGAEQERNTGNRLETEWKLGGNVVDFE